MLKKSVLRTIKKSLGRYFAILAIIALGVGFFIGLRVTENAMRATADQYLKEYHLYDFRLVSTLGFVPEDVEAFRELEGVENANGSVSEDMIIKKADGSDGVLHAHTLLPDMNGMDIVSGRLPQEADECVLDAHNFPNFTLGDKILLSDNNSEETFDAFAYKEYTVVGLVNAAEYINYHRGTTALADGKVTGYTYLLPEGFASEYDTEIYVTIPCVGEIYSEEYDAAVDRLREDVKELLTERADIRYEGIYNDARDEIDDAKQTLADKKKELADAQKEVDDGYETYQTEKADADKTFDDTAKKLDKAKGEIEKQKRQLSEQKDSPYAAMPEVQAQIAAAEGMIQKAEQEYQSQKDAYEQAVTEAEESFAEAKKKLEDAQAEIDEAKPEITDAEKEIADAEEELAKLEKPTVYVLDRSSNFGYGSFENDISIVSGVAKVFPVFFFLVAALVCITTMTRMVSDQRTQNGVLKALGYSSFAVAGQYLFYAGSASVIGCFAGFLVGSKFMPLALWEVYQIMYTIDRPVVFVLDWPLFFVCSFLYLICVMGVTYFVCYADLRESAAGLMRPEAPKAGKRIFLERIGFIWKHMKFLHKVSARNILRYKKRMVMMIIGIGGCMALLLTGFGIRDTIKPIADYQFGEITLYDASVSFLNAADEESRRTFDDGIKEFAADASMIHFGSVDIVGKEETKALDLVVFEEDMSQLFDLHKKEKAISWPGKNEAVINNGVAEAMHISVGDQVLLQDSDYREMTVTITGIYDNYIQDVVFLSDESYREGFGAEFTVNMAYVKFKDGIEEHEAAAELLNMDNVAAVTLCGDLKTRVDNMLGSLDMIVLIVLVCAGALAFIVLYNLTNITITERSREIATLKVLGFHRSEQNSYVFRENIILSLISAVCGIPMGMALLSYTMSQIKIDGLYFGCRLAFTSYVWALAITMLFTILVDLVMTTKTRNINMAEAMKAIE